MRQFKENGLVPETTVRTQPSRRSPKHQISLIFGILAKGGPHEKKFGKLKFYKWMKVTYFVLNQALMTMPQRKIGYDQYLLTYKDFFAWKMTSKMRSEYLKLTSLKLTWNERSDQAV